MKLKEQKSSQSILSVGVSPVSQSPQQENVVELMMKGGSGMSSTDSFAKLDQDGSWLKMSQDSYQQTLDGRLQEYSGTWPRAGMMLSGICSQREDRVVLERRTREKESLLWPTPTVADSAVYAKASQFRRIGRGLNTEVVLQEMWPTPTANEDAAGTPNGKMQKMLGNHPDVRSTGSGTLNPTWVEWLMGFPIGWGDLEHSETQSSPRSHTK